jgi:hypothetical protein
VADRVSCSWDGADGNGFGGAALAVARRIAHHFPTAGGVTDAHGVVQIAPGMKVIFLTELRPLEGAVIARSGAVLGEILSTRFGVI